MEVIKHGEEKFLVSFSDIWFIFLRFKKTILFSGALLSLLGILLALLLPINYKSNGTFREKGIKTNNFSSSSVMQFLGGSSLGTESEAYSLLSSRKIIGSAIKNLFLQANLEAESDKVTNFDLLKKNLFLSWAYLKGFSFRPFPDICCPLKFKNMDYKGEHSINLMIDLNTDGSFELRDFDKDQELVHQGKLGEDVEWNQLTFHLIPNSEYRKEIIPQKFHLSVVPLITAIEDISKNLKVVFAKTDKSLIEVTFEHSNRHIASELVNGIMSSYQSYLKNYHEELAEQQLTYLNQRRDYLRNNLNAAMQKHANFLTQGLYSSGFIESKKEMDFLAKSQYEYKQKLLDNELEIKRLMQIKPNSFVFYDRNSMNDGDPTVINTIFSEMRVLKQQRDALEIETQKRSTQQGVNFQESFLQQVNELQEVQLYLKELNEISSEFAQDKIPDNRYKLVGDTRFLLTDWFDRLKNQETNPSDHLKDMRESFQFYLNNLHRLFEVHERILQERLIHRQNPSREYQGISLEVATEIYLDYSKQFVKLEGNIRQNLFFIHQIEDPNFEVTSLSSGLQDPVSSEMIAKASQLILNLRDQNNQSLREQERIKDELQLQRTFLNMHLKQMVQLMELNKQLIDEKIFSLQNVSLELIHQNISLLEKNLKDYLELRQDNLHQERALIKVHLDNIQKEMSNLPEKWVSEQLLSQEIDANEMIVEEIVKLVESKNISHNLEIVQSAPIDLATPALKPVKPKVFVWGLMGFLLGMCSSLFFLVGRALFKGVRASKDNLKSLGFHVSGSLSSRPIQNQKNHNFSTLRRIQAYFDHHKHSNTVKFLLLIEGKGPHYAPDLAELIMKKGLRVLTIDLFSEDSSPGLLQYLNGEVLELPIQYTSYGDRISKGGATPHIIEIMSSKPFQALQDKLAEEYDWTLIAMDVLPCSIEAERLLPLFPKTALTIEEDTIEELNFYEYFIRHHPHHQLTFILTDVN